MGVRLERTRVGGLELVSCDSAIAAIIADVATSGNELTIDHYSRSASTIGIVIISNLPWLL